MALFLLELTCSWSLFALLYVLLLRKETFFRANRAYLMATAVLGVLLALPVDWLPEWRDKTGLSELLLPTVTIGIQQAEAAASKWQWIDFLWIVYFAGAALAFVRMFWGLLQIVRMAIRGHREKLPDGCVLIKTEDADAPFSFFRWVFVPRTGWFSEQGAGDVMLAHEQAHAHDWHSVDVLWVELLCVVFWFHPLAHWYRRSIRAVHEYLADAEASRWTGKKQYGLLLIRQAQSGVQLAFVNHFFQSPLKQRLIMLTRHASPAFRAIKYGFLVPVAAFLFLFACQKNTQDPIDVNPVAERATPPRLPADDTVFELFDVEQPPQFPGGQEALSRFLSAAIQYPEAAKKEAAEGIVVIVFAVDKDGAITDVEGVRSERSDWRQDFQDEAVRVVSSMPDWQPARSKGKPVKVKFTLPIRFKLR